MINQSDITKAREAWEARSWTAKDRETITICLKIVEKLMGRPSDAMIYAAQGHSEYRNAVHFIRVFKDMRDQLLKEVGDE